MYLWRTSAICISSHSFYPVTCRWLCAIMLWRIPREPCAHFSETFQINCLFNGAALSPHTVWFILPCSHCVRLRVQFAFTQKSPLVCTYCRQRPRFSGFLSGKCCMLTMLLLASLRESHSFKPHQQLHTCLGTELLLQELLCVDKSLKKWRYGNSSDHSMVAIFQGKIIGYMKNDVVSATSPISFWSGVVSWPTAEICPPFSHTSCTSDDAKLITLIPSKQMSYLKRKCVQCVWLRYKLLKPNCLLYLAADVFLLFYTGITGLAYLQNIVSKSPLCSSQHLCWVNLLFECIYECRL